MDIHSFQNCKNILILLEEGNRSRDFYPEIQNKQAFKMRSK